MTKPIPHERCSPAPIPPSGWPVVEGTFGSPSVSGPVGYAVVTPPGVHEGAPVAIADRLPRTAVRVGCGTADPFYANDRAFVAALPTPPEGSWFAGCHDGDSWRVVAPAQIAFLNRAFAAVSP